MNKFKNTIAVLLLVIAAQTAHSANEAKTTNTEQIKSSLAKISLLFKTAITYVPLTDEDGRSTVLACMSQVLLDWSEAELNALDHLPADFAPDPVIAELNKFAYQYFSAQQSLPVFNYIRPGLTEEINRELEIQRKISNVTNIDSTKFSLNDPQEDLFKNNLGLCVKPQFIAEIEKVVPLGDNKKELPIDLLGPAKYSISWVKSTNGGIKPLQNIESDSEGKKGKLHVQNLEQFIEQILGH